MISLHQRQFSFLFFFNDNEILRPEEKRIEVKDKIHKPIIKTPTYTFKIFYYSVTLQVK